MGRSRRKEKATNSLRQGQDSAGESVLLGEKDSQGQTVGFIDNDGLAYQSIFERDLIRCQEAIEDELRAWLERGFADPPVYPQEVAERTALEPLGKALRQGIHAAFRDQPSSPEMKSLFWLASAPDWSDAREQDCAKTALLYAAQMRQWLAGAQPEGKPLASQVAEESCRKAEHTQRAERVALLLWSLFEKISLERREERREVELHHPRYPLSSEGGIIIYPSFLEGSELALKRLTETAAEREALAESLRDLNQRLQSEGLGMVPEEVLESLEEEKEDDFDLQVETRPIWKAEWRQQLNTLGDTIQIETSREGVDDARRAGWKLEALLRRGPLWQEEVELKVIGSSQPPEEAKMQALEILAEGEEGEYLRRMKVLGVSEKQVLQRAEKVALGQSEDRSFLIAQATLFLPEVSEIRLIVAAENEEAVLRHLAPWLPGAHFPEEEVPPEELSP
jgi:hypothetical protein